MTEAISLQQRPERSSESHDPGSAARQFEAILLQTLLRPLEQTMGAVPGQTDDARNQDYMSLGTEALASALAGGKGFGIARLLLEQLQSTKPEVTEAQPQSGSSPLKIRR